MCGEKDMRGPGATTITCSPSKKAGRYGCSAQHPLLEMNVRTAARANAYSVGTKVQSQTSRHSLYGRAHAAYVVVPEACREWQRRGLDRRPAKVQLLRDNIEQL